MKQKPLIIGFAVFTILVTVALAFVVINLNSNINSNTPISFSLSYPKGSLTSYVFINPISSPEQYTLSQGIDIEFQSPSIIPGKQYTDDFYYLKTIFTTDYMVKSISISPSQQIIYNNNFAVSMNMLGEANPFGLGAPIPSYARITNAELPGITRIDDSENIALKSWFNQNHLAFRKLFYYSNDLRIGTDCGTNSNEVYCGTDFFLIPRSSEFSDQGAIQITCGVNELKYLDVCDQFVTNMKLKQSKTELGRW